MQTFLPAETFAECAIVIDSKRLNKQRVECLQVYNALTGRSSGWTNHPATLMWRGYEALLCTYAIKICLECNRRGFADNTGMLDKFHRYMNNHQFIIPWWWAEEATKNKIIHSHQCNLLRKEYSHYKKIFPWIPEAEIFITDYHWPAGSTVTPSSPNKTS